ncbi:MAG TPA: hypothetical protein VJJ52_06315 [Candidatus Nanoarchaeia archaeon]|nr:hypothetical protein [Candidatus Nanoarchaeia archaeon]
MEDGKAIPLHAKRVVSLPRNNEMRSAKAALVHPQLLVYCLYFFHCFPASPQAT